jgi:hypothetical protein
VNSVSRLPDKEIFKMTKEITQGQDGVLRWSFEFKLWKNPTIFITSAKVFLLAIQAPALLMFFLGLEDGFLSAIKTYLIINLLLIGIFSVLLILAYALIALIHAGSYCVLFEMDESGIRHTQMQKHVKKNQVMSLIVVLSGVAARNPGVMGAGLLSASKTSSYSHFSRVKSVIVRKNRNVIYVNEVLEKNQIYASRDDFDFVADFIISRTPKAKIKFK